MVDFDKKEEFGYEQMTNKEFAAISETIQLFMMEVEDRLPNNFLNDKDSFFPMWHDIIRANQIDNEYRYIFPNWEYAYDDFDIWWSGEVIEAKRAEANGLSWIKDAKTTFRQHMRVFYSQLADEDTYLKHFPLSGWSEAKMISLSHNRAILHPKIQKETLDKIYTEIIEKFTQQLYNSEFTLIVVHTNDVVGYSKGKLCSDLLFKLDHTAFIFHVYPINQNEKSNYKRSVSADVEKIIDTISEIISCTIENEITSKYL